jgi:hypothetical protein
MAIARDEPSAIGSTIRAGRIIRKHFKERVNGPDGDGGRRARADREQEKYADDDGRERLSLHVNLGTTNGGR